MSFKSIILASCFFVVFSFAQAQQFYNVTGYGAQNDSSKIATAAIKKAIDAASRAGGGTVYFPPGKYLTGPIQLKSNITIFIDAGAELHFSDNFDDYLPMVPSRWEGTDVTNFSPLFYAYKAENIAIIGRGIIDGHGKKWWDFSEGYDEKRPRTKWQLEFDRNNKDIIHPDLSGWVERGFLRPPFIQPMYCKNVRIEGISIRNSTFWTINPEYCDNVTITGVSINNPHSPNTDGINPESCRNVHISDCHISVGDDCITIKSGKDSSGRKANVPTENVTITNCTMLSGHGGVVIGSEMSGGVRKIVISNCIFDGTDRGIRIKTARGRGNAVEDIRVDNIIMNNIKMEAIELNMQYAKTKQEPVSSRTPAFRNIHFSNITAQTNTAAVLNGLEEMPIDDITFTDVLINAQNGMTVKNAKNIEWHNVRINAANGISLKIEASENIDIDGFKSTAPIAGKPVISLKDVKNAYIHNCNPAPGTDLFLDATGATNMVVEHNNLRNAKVPVQKTGEVIGVIAQ